MSLLCKLGSHDWMTTEKNGAYSLVCRRCSKTKPVEEKKGKSEDDS